MTAPLTLEQIDTALAAQAIAAVRKETSLTEDDARGFLAVALSGDQSALQDMLGDYQAAGAARDISVWETIGNVLLAIAPFAGAAATILGAAGAFKAIL